MDNGLSYNQRIKEGRERLLRCLYELGAEYELIDQLQLQNKYYEHYDANLNKAELSKWFSTRHLYKVLNSIHMKDDVEVSLSVERTGTLLMKLKRPMEVALADTRILAGLGIKPKENGAERERTLVEKLREQRKVPNARVSRMEEEEESDSNNYGGNLQTSSEEESEGEGEEDCESQEDDGHNESHSFAGDDFNDQIDEDYNANNIPNGGSEKHEPLDEEKRCLYVTLLTSVVMMRKLILLNDLYAEMRDYYSPFEGTFGNEMKLLHFIVRHCKFIRCHKLTLDDPLDVGLSLGAEGDKAFKRLLIKVGQKAQH